MENLKGKGDLFSAGTFKTSDGTMKYDGSPKKVKALKTYDTCTITSGKYTDNTGTERDLALNLLTVALADGTEVVFPYPLHEIILAGTPGTAMLYFD